MPSVQRVYDTWQDKDVAVLAIALDGDGAQAVKAFLKNHPYTVPMPADKGMHVARAFGARGVPTTYIVDRRGVIVAGGFGPIDFDSQTFQHYIATLVAQPRS